MNVLDMYLPFNKSKEIEQFNWKNILLVWYNLIHLIYIQALLFQFVYLIILCLVNPIPILNLLGLRYLHSLEGYFLLSIFGPNYRQTETVFRWFSI
jgi:hypothetical protein